MVSLNTNSVKASELSGVVLDCDIRTGGKIGGGTPTNNTAAINAYLATASEQNPIELIIDGGAAVNTLLIPNTGFVTIRGTGTHSGFFIISGTNGDGIRTVDNTFVPTAPEPIAGYYVTFKDFFINGNWAGNSTTGSPQGTPTYVYSGIHLHAMKHVTLENVYIYDSPSYGALFFACHDVNIVGCTVESPGRRNATDGFHFSGGNLDIQISNCHFETGDDAIAFNMDEGEHNAGARFAVSNITLNDCRTGVRVMGKGVETKNVVVNNVTGTIRDFFFVDGLELLEPQIAEANHSVTLSNIDVGFSGAYPPEALCWFNGSCGSIVFDNVQMNSPAFAVPFILTDINYAAGTTISNLVFNNCQIYRSALGYAAAYLIQQNAGTIKNLNITNFRVVNEVDGTYPAIANLIVAGSAITRLVLNDLDVTGVSNLYIGNIGTVINNSAASVAVTAPANTVWCGPVSGAAAAPSFRALVASDIPGGGGSGGSDGNSYAGLNTYSAGTTLVGSAIKGGIVVFGGGAAQTYTMPSTAEFSNGQSFDFVVQNSVTTLTRQGSDLLYIYSAGSLGSGVSSWTISPYGNLCKAVRYASNIWIIFV